MSKKIGKLKEHCLSLIKRFKNQSTMRSPSLLMTMFGDSIFPHGGIIWLGSLIKLAEPLGINQRLIRTSVYRLVEDGWLKAEKVGRRSYYTLNIHAVNEVKIAEKRIYGKRTHVWDSQWRLIFILMGKTNQQERKKLKQTLLWQGFGQIAPMIYSHPTIPMDQLADILHAINLDKKVVAMLAKNMDPNIGLGNIEMTEQCYKLGVIKKGYLQFIDSYKAIHTYLTEINTLENKLCFLLRTLLIHDYRRITLHDPQLPEELLINNWPGDIAHRLCAEIYRVTCAGAEQYIITECETPNGGMPASNPYYNSRFNYLLDT